VSGRRGFTLVEIVIALVIMLLVAGALHNLLVATQRLTLSQSQQVSLQSNVRAGSLAVANELRELSAVPGGAPEQNDILRIAPTAVTYRAMRGVGFVCQAPSATEIRINQFSGHRDPQAGRDSAYVLVAADPATGASSWLPLAITRVSTGAVCPGSLGAGISLTVPHSSAVASLEVGTPVRITEIMELRLYRSEGHSWLGARSVSAGETIQPVVGPLVDGEGFGLEYLSRMGVLTSDPTSVASIKVRLRAVVEVPRTGNREEELITRVALRNALQP
jgi:prepilin-type N-terminal cleavage/methylation domain-containing protein